MVDASNFQKLELFRDPNSNDTFVARDPSDGSTFAVPFDSIEANSVTVDGSLDANSATVDGSLEAVDFGSTATESIEDIVSTLVSSGNDISLSYDDANNNLIVSLTDSISTSSISTNSASADTIANTDYNETTQTISSASGTTDLDLSQANVFRVEAIDNISFTFSNVTATPAGNSVLIYVVDSDGAGPYTLSYPSSVVFNGGEVVGEVAQNSNVELSLLSDDGGTEFRARQSGGGFA